MIRRWMGVALMMLAVAGPAAGADAVRVEILEAPPEESILYSFHGDDQPGGWGWMGTDNAWRDVGMSFTSPADAEISAITIKVNRVQVQFLDQGKFFLKIYETRNLGEVPDRKDPIYTGRGEMLLNKGDDAYYVRIALEKPAKVQEGSVYTFLLAWEDAAAYQIVALETSLSYAGGRAWYRDGRDGALKALTQSDRPGLTFFIEHSPK